MHYSRTTMTKGRALRRILGSLCLTVAATLLPAGAALAQKGLPKPYVSPALDAVLLPITAEVRKEFKLGKKAAGVVIVSVDPGGIGELYGLEPGEVITELDDKIIRRPVDIDSMIRYKLNAGTNYFFFEGTWKNRKKKTIVELTNDDYAAPVSIADIPRWHGYNGGGAKARGKHGNGRLGDDGYFWVDDGYFYYADFCDGYLDYFPEVYSYSQTYIEEVIVTEVYITSIESSETVFFYDDAATGYDWPDDDYYIAETDQYYASEDFISAYDSTEVFYDDQNYDPETGLSYEEAEADGYLDPETYDESAAGDATTTDESAVDDGSGYVDDGSGYVDDGSGGDEAYVDDGSGYVDDGSGGDEAYVDDGSGYVDDGSGGDEAYADDGSGYVDDGSGGDEAYVDDGSGYVDDGTGGDETYVDDTATYEEPAAEEGYVDDGSGYVDDGSGYVDDGSGGDTGGDASNCYVDEDGNEVCG